MVVAVGADRDTSANAWIEILGVALPLLTCVVFEEHFVQLPAHLRDDHFLGILRAVDLNAPLRELRFHFFAVRWPADQLLERVEIDREMPEVAMSPRQNLVLHFAPLGELAQVIDDALRVCAEIMRPVIMDQHTGRIVMIISVAPDVVALLDNQASLAELAGDALGKHGAGKSRAYD